MNASIHLEINLSSSYNSDDERQPCEANDDTVYTFIIFNLAPAFFLIFSIAIHLFFMSRKKNVFGFSTVVFQPFNYSLSKIFLIRFCDSDMFTPTHTHTHTTRTAHNLYVFYSYLQISEYLQSGLKVLYTHTISKLHSL